MESDCESVHSLHDALFVHTISHYFQVLISDLQNKNYVWRNVKHFATLARVDSITYSKFTCGCGGIGRHACLRSTCFRA